MLNICQVVFSFLLTALSLPSPLSQFGIPHLSLFCLSPLYTANIHARSYNEAFIQGALWAGGVHILSSFWLSSFANFAFFTLGASAIGTAFIGGTFAVYLHYFLLKMKDSTCSISVFSIIYTLYEASKSTGFLAYPWGTLPLSLYKWTYIRQIARLTGVWGITFLFAFINGVIACYVMAKGNFNTKWQTTCKPIKIATAFTILSLIYGAFRINLAPSPLSYINAICVQDNMDPWNKLTEEERLPLLMQLTKSSLSKAKESNKDIDIIVWSEGVLKKYFPIAKSFYDSFPNEEPLLPFMADCGKPFLVGGSFVTDPFLYKVANSALYFDSNGDFIGHYNKVHLVPFGEVIPFADIPGVEAFLYKYTGFDAGWDKGSSYRTFTLPLPKQEKNITFASPICFEDAFATSCLPLYRLGADFFINITNDSWSQSNTAQWQHAILASYRCIECGISMLRSCQSGLSCTIDYKGQFITTLPPFTSTSSILTIPIYPHTPGSYAVFGNYFIILCIILLLILPYSIDYDIKSIRYRYNT